MTYFGGDERRIFYIMNNVCTVLNVQWHSKKYQKTAGAFGLLHTEYRIFHKQYFSNNSDKRNASQDNPLYMASNSLLEFLKII